MGKLVWAIALIAGVVVSTVAQATPIRALPNLTLIEVFERTGGASPVAFNFAPNGVAITNQLANPLSSSNNDINTCSEF